MNALKCHAVILLAVLFSAFSISAQDRFADSITAYFESKQYKQLISYAENDFPDTLTNDAVAIAAGLVAKSYFYVGDNVRALALYDRLSVFPFTDSLRTVQMNLEQTLVLIETGEYIRSEMLLENAVQYLFRFPDTLTLIRCLNYQGVLYLRSSQLIRARVKLEAALALAQKIGDVPLQTFILTHLGIVYRGLGNYVRALESYRASLEGSSQLNRPQDMAVDYLNIGNVYNEIGDYRQALWYYQKSRDFYAEVSDSSGISMVLGNQGYAFASLKQYDEAKRSLTAALALARAANDPLGEAEWFFRLAEIHYETGRLDSCLHQLKLSEQLFTRLSRVEESAEVLTASGICYDRLGLDSLAAKCFADARIILSENHLTKKIWLPLYQMAYWHEKRNEKTKAYAHYQMALDSLESSRVNLDAGLTLHFLEGERLDVYRSFASFLLSIDSVEKALTVLERSKSRSLSDWLGNKTNERALPDSTLFIEYFFQRDSVYAFLKSRTGLEYKALAGSKAVTETVAEYVGLLQSSRVFSQWHLSEKLYQWLIKPFERRIRNFKNLVIIPDGILFYLPFETLRDPQHYLIESFSVSYAPSLSVYRALSEREAPIRRGGIFALKNYDHAIRQFPGGQSLADLPFAEKERNDITGILSDTIEISSGQNFSEYDLLHFATHAINYADRPERSALFLANDSLLTQSLLTVSQIERMNLKAQLVVLSACETALGQLLQGEGMLGLPRAFLASGCRSVVATGWKVNDAAAAFFMKRFYTFWVRHHFNTTLALRETKKAMIADPNRHDPAFWGAFVLWGY